MSIVALGLNHTTAPVEVRERVAFRPDLLSDALRDLTSAQRVQEAAILSTCNRTEVYFQGGDPAFVATWLARFHDVPQTSLAPYLYTLSKDRAVTHTFRVASGLDSMVLGEPQILGQMKHAVRTAQAVGSLGLVLNRLFQRSFAVAKDVRTRTDIGTASISMGAAAVKLAERIFGALSGQRLLLVGAGEMIELAGSHFFARNPKSVSVANRTLERGTRLADRFAASIMTLEELPDRLHEFDIVITCTASTLPIIGKGTLERAVRQRRHSPILIVDLGVPRDVEAQAADIDDVFLYSIDDLQSIVRDNLSIRKEAVQQAEQMIADQAAHFLRWLEGRAVVPTIEALSRHYDAIRAAEFERARGSLAAGKSPELVVDALAHALSRKLLHEPLAALNEANGTERTELIAALSRIHRLDQGP